MLLEGFMYWKYSVSFFKLGVQRVQTSLNGLWISFGVQRKSWPQVSTAYMACTGKTFVGLGVHICVIFHKYLLLPSLRRGWHIPPIAQILVASAIVRLGPEACSGWWHVRKVMYTAHLTKLKDENSYTQQPTSESMCSPSMPNPTPKMKISSPTKAICEKNLEFYLSCMLEIYRL